MATSKLKEAWQEWLRKQLGYLRTVTTDIQELETVFIAGYEAGFRHAVERVKKSQK